MSCLVGNVGEQQGRGVEKVISALHSTIAMTTRADCQSSTFASLGRQCRTVIQLTLPTEHFIIYA